MDEPRQVMEDGTAGGPDGNPGDDRARLRALYEPMIALATTAKVCGYQLSLDTPDLIELKELVARMIASADHAITICRGDGIVLDWPTTKGD